MKTSSASSHKWDETLPSWFQEYISVEDFNIFLNTIGDISGKSPLPADDPRYLHLLDLDIISFMTILNYYDSDHPLLVSFLHKWRLNNPKTKNFVVLVELTIQRVRACIHAHTRRIRRDDPVLTDHIVRQGCNGLFFVALMLQSLTLNSADEEIRLQLCVSNNWPEESLSANRQTPVLKHNSSEIFMTTSAIDRLIDDCVSLIAIPQEETNNLGDIKLFCVEVLMVMSCSELYKPTRLHQTRLDDDNLQLNQHSNLLQQYLFKRCGAELQKALSTGVLNSTFLDSHAVRLVKGLVHQSSSFDQKGGDVLQNIQRRWNHYANSRRDDKSFPNNNTIYSTVKSVFSKFQLFWFLEPSKLNLEEAVKDGRDGPDSKAKEINSLLFLKSTQGFPCETEIVNIRSAQLLLLLIHQRSVNGIMIYNPFREAFNLLIDDALSCQDDSDDVSDIEIMDGCIRGNIRGKNSCLTNSIHVDFCVIIKSIERRMPDPTFVLLFYSFMQMHTTFVEFLRSSECAPAILVKCLKGLYQAQTTSSINGQQSYSHHDHSSHLYTLLISVLLIVQDPLLISGTSLHNMVECEWYHDKNPISRVKTMAILDVLILIMLKTSTYSIFRLHDQYILSHIHAVVMNLVTATHSLSTTVSERLVKTILGLSKRANKEYEKFNSIIEIQQQFDRNAIDYDNDSAKVTESGVVHVSSSKSIIVPLVDTAIENKALLSDQLKTLDGGPPTEQISAKHFLCNTLSAESIDQSLPPTCASRIDTIQGDSNAQLLSLIRLGLKHLIDFTTSILRHNLSGNTNIIYSIMLDHSSLSAAICSEAIQTLLVDDDDYFDNFTNFESSYLHDKSTRNALFLINVGRLFLNYLENPQESPGIPSEQWDKYRYYTAKEAMDQLNWQVSLLEIEINTRIQRGLVTNRNDWCCFLESKEFTGSIDWNAIDIQSSERTYHKNPSQRLKYVYKESENPDEFFLPYIWRRAVSSSPEMMWRLHLLISDKSEE